MDKHTINDRDIAWKEVKARRETVSMGKLSQKLISIFELGKMWLSLEPGQCIVLSADGSIHRGSRVNAHLDKMTKLQEAYKTERHSDLLRVESDLRAAEEVYPILGLGGTKRANNWDTRTRLAPGSSKAKATKAAPKAPSRASDI